MGVTEGKWRTKIEIKQDLKILKSQVQHWEEEKTDREISEAKKEPRKGEWETRIGMNKDEYGK